MHGAGNIWGDSYGLRPLTRAAPPREPECGQKQRQAGIPPSGSARPPP